MAYEKRKSPGSTTDNYVDGLYVRDGRLINDRFPGETSLLTGIARIYEGIGNLSLSAKYYKLVLRVNTGIF